MNIGLALSGGGVKGAVHIGVLKALEEQGIEVSYVSGASSGSIVAVLYASGYSPKEIHGIFKKYCKKIKYVELKQLLKLIYGIIFKRKIVIDGFNTGNIIEKIMKENCLEKNISFMNELKKTTIISSVDYNNGELYFFTSEINREDRDRFTNNYKYIDSIEVGKAVRASCSFPGVFSPCSYNNKKLIDGGVRENTPWKEIKKLGADRVISIVFEEDTKYKCCDNFVDVINNSIKLICFELSNYELEGTDFIIKVKTPPVSLLDDSKIDELYDLGYYIAKKEMNNILRMIQTKNQQLLI